MTHRIRLMPSKPFKLVRGRSRDPWHLPPGVFCSLAGVLSSPLPEALHRAGIGKI